MLVGGCLKQLQKHNKTDADVVVSVAIPMKILQLTNVQRIPLINTAHEL